MGLPLEFLTFATSVAGSAGLTMAGNVVGSVLGVFEDLGKNARQAKQEQSERDAKAFEYTERSQRAARDAVATPSFHTTRKWIAKVVIFSYFVSPMFIPFIGALVGIPVAFTVGYMDISRGWPWQESVEAVEWLTFGAVGGITIMITPVMSNSVTAIIGMFFGNQMVKR